MPLLKQRVKEDISAMSLPGGYLLADLPSLESGALRSRPRPGLLVNCANPSCRSGWLHLTRSRSWPIFENGWTCSPECTTERLAQAVRREMESRSASQPHRHRVPLGLLLLKKGWISADQFKEARQRQRREGGRIGHWLVRHAGITEDQLTHALAQQWSRPVLALDSYDPGRVSSTIPRLFSEAFALTPLRLTGSRLLYVGYAQDPDPVLELAIESMTGTKVQAGFLPASQFAPAHQRYLSAAFPPAEFLEAISGPALVRALTGCVERNRPWQSRLVRVHDWLWLRMWLKRPPTAPPDAAGIRDVICVISGESRQ